MVHDVLKKPKLFAIIHLSFDRLKDGTSKEMMGIFVSYRVKVKLVVSLGGYVKIIYASNFFSLNIMKLLGPLAATLH